jgi:hypothetical protein
MINKKENNQKEKENDDTLVGSAMGLFFFSP